MLGFLSGYVLNSSERSKLEELATNAETYEVWKKHRPDLVDVLKEFPSLYIDSAHLVYMMKTLQPRYSDLYQF